MLKKYIGDHAFYRHVLALTIPIMVQNFITNFVSMLDNIMIGRLGAVPMNGVTIANQLIFVFYLCIFGAVSGAGIFGAQYYGCQNHEGVTHTLRFKLIFCTLLTAVSIGIFLLWQDTLVGLYLKGEGSPADAAASLAAAEQYIFIMLFGLIPYTVVQCYSSTLRETGKTLLPMAAGVAAVLVNLTLNYMLIFGHWGAPRLGVQGAAIATVISRYVELVIVLAGTHSHPEQNRFVKGLYRRLYVPGTLVRQIILKGLPLMGNELVWALGTATVNQCYSLRGLHVVSANSITQTFFDVFSVAFMAVGATIGIILGQQLGAGNKEGAMDASRKLIAFSCAVSVVVALVFALCAGWIPLLYNTTQDIRQTATKMMLVCALVMPIHAFAHATYFTLRSGGKTLITILFDSCYIWVVTIPLANVLVHFTDLPIVPIYFFTQFVAIFKCFFGYYLVKKGVWIRTIVDTTPSTQTT